MIKASFLDLPEDTLSLNIFNISLLCLTDETAAIYKACLAIGIPLCANRPTVCELPD